MFLRRESTLKHCPRFLSRPKKSELPKKYDCDYVESCWYKFWKDSGQFESDLKKKESFTLCLPPPNVTGRLHLGHALMVTIEDALARYHRMKGKQVCWVPGFDHAGISTQSVVEKKLLKERGLAAKDLPRSEFLTECESWKNQQIADISNQLKVLGASLDWSKQYYTMDEKFSQAVTSAFKSLFDDGLIFRDLKLINWSCAFRSTISDQEVDWVEVSEPRDYQVPGSQNSVELGWIYHVDYSHAPQSFDDTGPCLTVATTRPETILADVALAVNPRDPRYSRLVGRKFLNPLIPEKLIPLIADERVEMNKGTGILKVTPAHDFTDWDIGKDHDLPLNDSCLDDQGFVKQNRKYGELAGLQRFKARKKALSKLSSVGCLRAKIANPTTVPVCSKSGDLIEPKPMDQWFMDCRELSERCMQEVSKGRLQFIPEHSVARWNEWCTKSKQWCLSRQLAWGHRVPAYNAQDVWVSAHSANEARKLLEAKGIDSQNMTRDPDVLDTWFSSSLVPLVAAGWPGSPLLSSMYPLSLMETGHDILGFWVVRMVMMGLHFTKELPFKKVLLHGIVRDGNWKKMSKSEGNVIDPIDVIRGNEASNKQPRGSDALRFSLLRHDITTSDVAFDVAQVETVYHFCNKLWQATNYCQLIWDEVGTAGEIHQDFLESIDLWILSRLAGLVDRLNNFMDSYSFNNYTKSLLEFFVDDFCDLYLESTKSALWSKNSCRLEITGSILQLVMDTYLRCLAPIMPYLAEELYGRLPNVQGSSVHLRTFPILGEKFLKPDLNLDSEMVCIREILHSLRSVRKQLNLPGSMTLEGCLQAPEPYLSAIGRFGSLLSRLTNFSCTKIHHNSLDIDSDQSMIYVAPNVNLLLDIQTIDKPSALRRLDGQYDQKQKLASKIRKQIERTRRIGVSSEKQREKYDRICQEKQAQLDLALDEIRRISELLNVLR